VGTHERPAAPGRLGSSLAGCGRLSASASVSVRSHSARVQRGDRRGLPRRAPCRHRPSRTQTTKRGFASERAARDARRRLIEQVERGEVRHTKETFSGYWGRWLERRRPYLEPGTWSGYEIAGRKRLLPAFGAKSLGELSVDAIREFVDELAEEVEAGELAAKTVNNALGMLVVCLNSAVEDGVLSINPALRVQRLPPGHIEREYLRLDEIPRYLDACSDVYRPLAELLVGSGLRISEALALRIGDLELEETGGAIVVYRSRKGSVVGSTKSDRFRSVEIGPGLSSVLRDHLARGAGGRQETEQRLLCSRCRFEP
jgi:integrase